MLAEAAASAEQKFDVFLSHSSGEPQDVLLGVKALLEDNGLSVYINKYSDPQLSPENVTLKTATILRDRMRNSTVSGAPITRLRCNSTAGGRRSGSACGR